MIDVSRYLGYYLNNATHREKKLIGVLYPNGQRRCFLEHCKYNERHGKILYKFESQESIDEWYDLEVLIDR